MRVAAMLVQSLRFARRDARAGELRLLVAALLVAVAAVSSVGFFVDRMRLALSEQATQLIGADLVLVADHPIDPRRVAQARDAGLQTASTAQFPSMALSASGTQLASVKAVSEGYPLRGRVRIAGREGEGDQPADGIPAPGTAWVDAQLLPALGLRNGERLQLGDAWFTVAAIVTLEPDRGANFVNFAPRVLIREDELARTALIQPASRVSYRLLVAGPARAVDAYRGALERALGRGERIESLDNGRPELRATLDRAERFLALVALLTALIAAVAIALAARRFAERHLDGCAVMRAIGVSQGRLASLLAMELAWVGVAGGVAGALVGWAVHFVLVAAIAPLIDMPLPLPSAWPAVHGIAAGLVLLVGFGGFPFIGLAAVPPLRVLRRELGRRAASAWLTAGTAAIAFAALLAWFARDRTLAAVAIGGFAAGAIAFALVAAAVVRLAGPLRRVASGWTAAASLRLALASWTRRPGATIAQTVALAIGLMALMLLTITRTDLVQSWRRASPPDAPNRFVINIQPDQQGAVRDALRSAGVGAVTLYPMVRGRLVAVNGERIDPAHFDDERARRLVDREFNLSYMDSEPSHNRTVEGRWLDPARPEVSVEQGIMQTLGLALGDRLTFDIAGEPVQAVVTGARKLAWDSMKVNFFMIVSPSALADRPQTWITAYHEPPSLAGLSGRLVREFPNLTVFDTGYIVRQVQSMLEQVIQAVQLLFGLTLAAGVVVLYAALAASRDERVRDTALMRALGASRSQLGRAQLWELGIAGGVAGLLAAAGSLAIGAVLAARVFNFAFEPRWSTLPLGLAAGALVAIFAGWIGLRGVMRAAPIATLREAA